VGFDPRGLLARGLEAWGYNLTITKVNCSGKFIVL